jgi:tRNA (guanine-N7-)-methyltransferase
MNKRRDFEWQINAARDFQVRPDDWPETRYERKARTVYGHEVWYFRYVRV